jgi:hypothetical protein
MRKRITVSRRAFVGGLALTSYFALSGNAATRSAVEDELPPFVLPREGWGATAPRGEMRPHSIERVTLHHTGPPAWYGRPPADAYLRAIQAFHMGPERGWPDIAYHFLIDLDGTVWQGRPLTFAGDTATNYDPTGHALIAVLGDYDVQQPATTQVDAVVRVARWLAEHRGVSPGAIGGHRDLAATACPGRNLYALLDSIRSAVAAQ